MDNFDPQINRKAYNQMASVYLQNRGELRSYRYVNKFEIFLPRQAEVLDLGCGAGIPVDDYLIKKGHLVTGLDISETQISIAKQKCPTGAFFVRDLLDLQPGEFQVDGIISLYTIFHLPRKKHLWFLETIGSFLKSGGKLLISMGDEEFEQEHLLHGQKVWSSHYGRKKNLELVKQTGFEVIFDEVDQSGKEKHQFILAEKL